MITQDQARRAAEALLPNPVANKNFVAAFKIPGNSPDGHRAVEAVEALVNQLTDGHLRTLMEYAAQQRHTLNEIEALDPGIQFMGHS